MKNAFVILSIATILISCTEANQSNSEGSESTQHPIDNSLEFKAKQTSIYVIDTDFSKGRLTNKQEISLWDVQKMHGHLCDGLVVGFLGLREGLYELYPDSLIDRTNTRIVSQSSPCIGDIGLYLTGGRYQFNSFYIDESIQGVYVVQRIDNGKAVRIVLKPGIKPPQINTLGAKAVKNELDACGLDSLRKLEDNFSRQLLKSNPKKLFEIVGLDNFQWQPVLKNEYKKTDVLNKNAAKC